MNSELVNWISIVGSFLSLLGVIIALIQISKTRRAAEAAKDASLQTQKAISRNLLISDVSNSIKHIEETRLYVRGENFELALVRVNDFNSNLIQMQKVLEGSTQIHQIDFIKIHREIKKIRIDLRNTIEGNTKALNRVRINNQLDFISDNLNKLIGETKILIGKDN
ncbi:MAG: hypothetical protein WA584_19945 [Pyrinomonadaceae bacterium]